MAEDVELDRRLTEALTEILRDHLPNVSGAGRVTEFVVGVEWADEAPGDGTYVFFDGSPLAAYGLGLRSVDQLRDQLKALEQRRRESGWDDEDDED